MHHAVGALRAELAAAEVDAARAEDGALAADAEARVTAVGASQRALRERLVVAKAERIVLQAEADGDDEDDADGDADDDAPRRSSTVELDAVFDGGGVSDDGGGGGDAAGAPHHHHRDSFEHHGAADAGGGARRRGSTFEQAAPGGLAPPPAARAELARLNSALKRTRAALGEALL